MITDWFYLCGAEIVGPLTASDLRAQALAGQVTPQTPVRRGDEGNWIPAKKVKGLFDAPQTSPLPPVPTPPVVEATLPNVRTETIEQNILATANSGHGSDKSTILFIIGGVLLFIAFMMYVYLDKKEKAERALNHTSADIGAAFTGRYEPKETQKQDQVGLYAVGGVGALFILGAVVTMSGNKK